MLPDLETQRRKILKGGIAVSAAATVTGLPFWSKLALAQSEELVQFTDMPEGFVAPPVSPGAIHFLDTRYIDSFYTPTDDFYIIQHYNQPVISEQDFSLRVTGMVDNQMNISFADIQNRPKWKLMPVLSVGVTVPLCFMA